MNNFSIIENGIIPVYLSDKGTRLVNMRELHAWLGVETRFNDWITRRIMQYGFIENEDYLLLKNEYGENTAFQAKDYIFKLEPAKEIALVENNEKGRELRRYFIQVEEKYRLQVKQDSYMISDPIERARRWIQEQEQKKVLESKVKELTPAAEFGNAVSNNAGGLLIRDYVKVLENDGVKIGQDKFFSWLHINNYIYRQKGYKTQWIPYKMYVEQGLFRVKETPVSNNDHGDWIAITIRITGKGQKYFYEKLKAEQKSA